MRKFLLLLFVSTIFVSCNKVPNRSIFEPLKTEELADIIKSDTLFEQFYAQQNFMSLMVGDIDKAKFNHITWRGMYKMFKYVNDEEKLASLNSKLDKEWNRKYKSSLEKTNSLIDRWGKYRDSISLNKFVKVNFKGIDHEYSEYSSNYPTRAYVTFDIEPLKGDLSYIKLYFRYHKKDGSYNNDDYLQSTNLISKKEPSSWNIYRAEFFDNTTESFLNDYKVEVHVLSVHMVDGDVNYGAIFADQYLVIPQALRNLQEIDSTIYPEQYIEARDVIAKELVDTSYVSNSVYRDQERTSLLKKKFPKEREFVEYLFKR